MTVRLLHEPLYVALHVLKSLQSKEKASQRPIMSTMQEHTS